MSDDDAPKSAVELAMEKLRMRGDYEEVKLTDEQKAEIADIRSRCHAQIAKLEIQHEARSGWSVLSTKPKSSAPS